PLALVLAVFTPPAKVPLAPLVGALNVIVLPGTGFPKASCTVAARFVGKAVFTVVLCGVPAVAVIEAGGPGRLVITKPGFVVRVFAVAVTVYLPEVVLALRTCDVAIPLALVIAVFPQAKTPLAPLVGGLNVTSKPETGCAELSSTVATRRLA